MNGRCETNPLDQAVNVCGTCYGDFCDTCLVTLKGRKHPICKQCAIIVAGVRGSEKPAVRGSRSTAKERRAKYKDAPVQNSGFKYFDSSMNLGQPFSYETAQDDSEQEKKPKKGLRLSRTASADDGAEQSAAETSETESASSGSKRSTRKRKTPEPVLDNSSELDRLDDLGSNLASKSKSDEGDMADGTDQLQTSNKYAPRSSSAIDKLEEIQSAEAATPHANAGRQVPPRKASIKKRLKASAKIEEPPEQAQQDMAATKPKSDAIPTKPVPSGPSFDSTTNVPADPTGKQAPPKAKHADSGKMRKDRKAWPKTDSKPAAKDTPASTSASMKKAKARPTWPGSEKPKAAVDEAAPVTNVPVSEAPISGSAILDNLTDASSNESAPSPTQAEPIHTAESTPEQMGPDFAQSKRSDPLQKPTPEVSADTPLLPPDREPEFVAPVDKPKEAAISGDYSPKIYTGSESELPVSSPPAPTPTQAQRSTADMAVVGLSPSADDSPTSEFESPTEATPDAFAAANDPASTHEDAAEIWDPAATPWDSATTPWDSSAPFDSEESTPPEEQTLSTVDDSASFGDGGELSSVGASMSQPVRSATEEISSAEALTFGAESAERRGVSGAAGVTASADTTTEFKADDEIETDEAGNWVPPALRGGTQKRRPED